MKKIDTRNKVFTEISINATPKQVWHVLTDWNKLKEWSTSFIGVVDGKMALGEVSTALFINPMNKKEQKFTHTITEFEEEKIFGWSGPVGFGAKDHHIYSLESTPNGNTIFRQEDGFHGGMAFIINPIMKRKLTKAYDEFNQQLKYRVESSL